MKALVFHGPRDIRYETFEDPALVSPNSVILKVRKCSICGSDLHMYHGDNIGDVSYHDGSPHFCTGHEFIGEVVEVGAEVRTFRVGDQVLSEGATGCGKCAYCQMLDPAKCRQNTAFGIGPNLQGGQAEYVCVPNADRSLLKTNEDISDEHAILLTDALATAYFGVSRAGLRPGGNLAVIGLGPIGILGVEIAYALGASIVFAIDPIESRRMVAEQAGAIALEPSSDLKQIVKDRSLGVGVSSVFEASGASPAIETAFDLVGYGGTLSCIGLPRPDAQLALYKMVQRNLTVRAGLTRVHETWQALLPLVQSGRIEGRGVFTHSFDLSEGAEAYRLFDAREDDVVKIMIHVG
ncbi:MAG: alcohol dehydrogenase catalytic domain-containing protein [Henriciella sp.]